MTQVKPQKPVAHIYAFAFTWLFYALIGVSLQDVMDVLALSLIAFLISTIVFLISFLIRKIRKKNSVAEELLSPIATSAHTGNLELDAVIHEGLSLLGELQNASLEIKNQEIVQRVNEIIDMSHKIIEKLKRQPQLLSSAKRFFNYYLPTTTKLITNYSYMENQGVTGGNISNTMQKIENSLTSLANAYKTQLDTLFSHTAIDLETDIAALEQILKQEGLLQNEFKGEEIR